ncbi:MAG: hypothetical protein KGO48_12780 [Alphaproteobacteria bacterium]|nr:hypothetical protein [Alphaproteobacteria bacterium]
MMWKSARLVGDTERHVQTLRSSAERLKKIASTSRDRQTATLIIVCAEELEREANLEVRCLLELS